MHLAVHHEKKKTESPNYMHRFSLGPYKMIAYITWWKGTHTQRGSSSSMARGRSCHKFLQTNKLPRAIS